jgi:hypothetical protein
VGNKARHKEDKKDVYLFNPAVEGRTGNQGDKYVYYVDCNGCDNSMNVLFAVLENVRGTRSGR